MPITTRQQTKRLREVITIDNLLEENPKKKKRSVGYGANNNRKDSKRERPSDSTIETKRNKKIRREEDNREVMRISKGALKLLVTFSDTQVRARKSIDENIVSKKEELPTLDNLKKSPTPQDDEVVILVPSKKAPSVEDELVIAANKATNRHFGDKAAKIKAQNNLDSKYSSKLDSAVACFEKILKKSPELKKYMVMVDNDNAPEPNAKIMNLYKILRGDENTRKKNILNQCLLYFVDHHMTAKGMKKNLCFSTMSDEEKMTYTYQPNSQNTVLKRLFRMFKKMRIPYTMHDFYSVQGSFHAVVNENWRYLAALDKKYGRKPNAAKPDKEAEAKYNAVKHSFKPFHNHDSDDHDTLCAVHHKLLLLFVHKLASTFLIRGGMEMESLKCEDFELTIEKDSNSPFQGLQKLILFPSVDEKNGALKLGKNTTLDEDSEREVIENPEDKHCIVRLFAHYKGKFGDETNFRGPLLRPIVSKREFPTRNRSTDGILANVPKNRKVLINSQMIQKLSKEYAVCCGFDEPKRNTCHANRKGGITKNVKNGVPLDVSMNFARHKDATTHVSYASSGIGANVALQQSLTGLDLNAVRNNPEQDVATKNVNVPDEQEVATEKADLSGDLLPNIENIQDQPAVAVDNVVVENVAIENANVPDAVMPNVDNGVVPVNDFLVMRQWNHDHQPMLGRTIYLRDEEEMRAEMLALARHSTVFPDCYYPQDRVYYYNPQEDAVDYGPDDDYDFDPAMVLEENYASDPVLDSFLVNDFPRLPPTVHNAAMDPNPQDEGVNTEVAAALVLDVPTDNAPHSSSVSSNGVESMESNQSNPTMVQFRTDNVNYSHEQQMTPSGFGSTIIQFDAPGLSYTSCGGVKIGNTNGSNKVSELDSKSTPVGTPRPPVPNPYKPSAVDRRTAVMAAPRPPVANPYKPAAVDRRTAVVAAPRPPVPNPYKPSAVDCRTAVMAAPRPPVVNPYKPAAVDCRTAVMAAPRPPVPNPYKPSAVDRRTAVVAAPRPPVPNPYKPSAVIRRTAAAAVPHLKSSVYNVRKTFPSLHRRLAVAAPKPPVPNPYKTSVKGSTRFSTDIVGSGPRLYQAKRSPTEVHL